MAKKTVQKMVRQAVKNSDKGRAYESGLRYTQQSAHEKNLIRKTKICLIIFGFGLGVNSLPFAESWVTRSPLLTVVGSAGLFLFLFFCSFVGMLWWVITRSTAIIVWAYELLPFAFQPWRSASGICVVFIFLAAYSRPLIYVWRRIPWIWSRWKGFLNFLTVFTLIVAFVTWAIVVFPVFIKVLEKFR